MDGVDGAGAGVGAAWSSITMFGYTTTITTALIHRIARGRRFMGDLFMLGRRITGITGLGIVRLLRGIARMGRTTRVIDRRRTMVDVRLILEMAGGHQGTM